MKYFYVILDCDVWCMSDSGTLRVFALIMNTVYDIDFLFCAGDVSPISMSPISQSQFIPLGEILCLAISAMNSARKPVTQEALMEHLTTCFPGNLGRSVHLCLALSLTRLLHFMCRHRGWQVWQIQSKHG